MPDALIVSLARVAAEHPETRPLLMPYIRHASKKTARLMARQEVILQKYLGAAASSGVRAATDWDELPDRVRQALQQVKDQETLWMDVNRWFMDNAPPHLRWASGDDYVLRVEKGKGRGSYPFKTPQEAVSAAGDHGSFSDKDKAKGLVLLRDGKPWSVDSSAGSFTIRPPKGGGKKEAAWENLPPGWTQESLESFWDSLTGDVKHKVTKCMKEMEGKIDDPGAFCGSLARKLKVGMADEIVARWNEGQGNWEFVQYLGGKVVNIWRGPTNPDASDSALKAALTRKRDWGGPEHKLTRIERTSSSNPDVAKVGMVGVAPKSRQGTRVVVHANPASRMLYRDLPPDGTPGAVRSVAGPGGPMTYMPGPGGGLLYVQFDDGSFMGVSPRDLAYEGRAGGEAFEGRSAGDEVKVAINIPKEVEDYAKEVAEGNPSYDEAQVWATAWSIYCRYKSPGSEHCTKAPGEYFPGRMARDVEGLRPRPAPARKPRSYKDYVSEVKGEGRTPLTEKEWSSRQHGSGSWGIREAASPPAPDGRNWVEKGPPHHRWVWVGGDDDPAFTITEHEASFGNYYKLQILLPDGSMFKTYGQKETKEDWFLRAADLYKRWNSAAGFDLSKTPEKWNRLATNRLAEWKGWTPDMPVQIVTMRGTEVFPNLAAAQAKYPTLDPRRNTKDFTWATKGEVRGRPAIRFEDWPTERMLSLSASGGLLKHTAALASKDASLRAKLMPLIREAAINIGDTVEFEKSGIRIHRFRDSFRVTDLANAGKRGKKVDEFWVSYWQAGQEGPIHARVAEWMEFAPRAMNFNILTATIQLGINLLNDEGVSIESGWNTLRGVDVAPGGFGPIKINGDNVYIEAGWQDFVVRDKADKFNLPVCIPAIRGGKADIKVFYRWVTDNQAAIKRMDFHQVLDGMRDAGVAYHQYCSMD
jgi:hypothetical protein